MEKYNWTMKREGDEGSPFVLAAEAGGVFKYLEDPVEPESEALAAFKDMFEKVGVLAMVPCSEKTMGALESNMPGLKEFLVVDDDPARLAAWKKGFSWKGRAKVDTLLIHGEAGAYQGIKDKLASHMDELFKGRCHVHIPRRFRRFSPKLADTLERTALAVQREACSRAAYHMLRSWHVNMNRILNLGHQNVLRIDEGSIAPGQAVVIVGAGPSLDDTVGMLREYQDRAIILVVDAAFKALVANGVRPDFILTCEDVHLSWRHFSGVDKKYLDVPLVATPSTNFVLVRNHPGGVVFTERPDAAKWSEPACRNLMRCDLGGSVGHYAFHMAENLNPEVIVMTGFDLSIRPGATHSKHMSLPEEQQRLKLVDVESLDGGKTKTSHSFMIYLRQFEECVKAGRFRVVNATGSGAVIHGTEVGKLDDLLRDRPKAAKPRVSPDNYYKNFDCDSMLEKLLANVMSLADGIGRHVALLRANGFKTGPFTFSPGDSEALALMASCSGSGIYNKFVENEINDAGAADELEDVTRWLASFLRVLFEVRKFRPSNDSRALVLSDGSEDMDGRLATLGLTQAAAAGPDVSLVEAWELVMRHDAGAIVCFDGRVLPDMWSAPGVRCVDIKTRHEPHDYEKSLWTKGYEVFCEGRDVFERWDKFLPPDIKRSLK